MTQMADSVTTLLDHLQQVPAQAPDWLAQLRQRGAAAFEKRGLPTTRDEEWQQTNVAALGKTAFELPAADTSISDDTLAGYSIPQLDAYPLLFVDGRFEPSRTALDTPPTGVIITNLRDAITSHGDLVRQHLGQHIDLDADPFAALNTAYLDEGAFVYVPRNAKLDKPIHLLFVSTDSPQPTMTHPRVLIVVEQGGEASVIEQHAGSGATAYFSNAVTEVIVGDNAHATHLFIERDSKAAYNVSTLQIHQGRDSHFASHTLLLGGKLVRNNVNPVIAGQGCHSLLNGLYLPTDGQHMDNHMRVHHQAPNCDSRQYYTGVFQGDSSGAFIGRIVVDRAAQKTDAVQSSRNLLLSDKAHAHNRPQLEISADDVKCTHGSTTGELDEQSVFYLRSRGIPEDVARGLLVYAFAGEAIDRIEIEPVRAWLGRLLIEQISLSPDVQHVLD